MGSWLSGSARSVQFPVVGSFNWIRQTLLSVPVKKKEPVTPEVIQRLFAYYGSSPASLSDLRVLTLCILDYARFFRIKELVRLRECDFQFEDAFMIIFVHRNKTGVHWEGAWVVIA